jgi:hypothetical protein
MTMKTLRNWSARRAGGRITITHAEGKVTGVDSIACEDGRIIALAADGEEYELGLDAATEASNG